MKTTGNTLLITGGTSGIGQAFATEFYKRGNTVIICGRREERLQQMAAQHPGMITRICDVADEKQRTALYEWVVTHYPGLNVLMNNAGIQLATDLTQPVHLDNVNREVETNFIAPIHLASLFAAHLAAKADGVIINITSGLAFVPIAFMPVYCATKAGMHSLTMSLRYQLRNTAVKVFEIAPPSTDTELGHERREDKSQSHGGLPVHEFLAEAMEALEQDKLEAPIAQSKGLRAKGEELFSVMNH
jgi:uncharacterized oxidoreductase